MAIPATHIQEVADALDAIIAQCLAQNSKLGLFAALYRKVTLRVQAGIASGRFEDGARMERLAVRFANRYLEAYQAYTTGQPLTAAWGLTFQAAKNPMVFMIQHLLAGMNTHISLDLGIAAAKTAEGQPLIALERDFNEINLLLGELINDVQNALEKTSTTMTLIDWLGGQKDEELARFSLELFRKRAWHITNTLYGLDETQRAQHITDLDHAITNENNLLTHLSSLLMPSVVRLAAFLQTKKAASAIKAINAI
jgi:Family of unknown function (DUF5995)